MSDFEEAWEEYLQNDQEDYASGRNRNSSIPRRDTFLAGWNAALAAQKEN